MAARRHHRGRYAALTGLVVSLAPLAQAAQPMSFFVTSSGNGNSGGNYAGLSGADARCQSLATNAGAGSRTWAAYLSTAPIDAVVGGLVHARDRIGTGPWYNFTGVEVAASVAALHANGIADAAMLTETGATVPLDEHDILTGSLPDGTAMTTFPGNPTAPPPNCLNWTTAAAEAYAFVGHSNASTVSQSWNSQHETACDPAGLRATAGTGRLYCFATNGATASTRIFANGFEDPRGL